MGVLANLSLGGSHAPAKKRRFKLGRKKIDVWAQWNPALESEPRERQRRALRTESQHPREQQLALGHEQGPFELNSISIHEVNRSVDAGEGSHRC